MKFRKLVVIVLISPLSLFAQKIPNDPNVKTGQLENGLTYYIRKNNIPEKKVEMRLIIKAGSVLETEKQKGLAHFVEHMVFNGTKSFPKNEMISYLQSIGIKFGSHLNAATGYDETTYYLPLPTDDIKKLDKGFQILEDWAFNATMKDEDINNERNIVIEEYRTRISANSRMQKDYLPKLLNESKYAYYPPIGTLESLKTFQNNELRQFYKDWYRPNLMSIAIVGDIDVNEMEQKIKKHFNKYTNPKNEKKVEEFKIANHKETIISINSDKEQTNSELYIFYKDINNKKSINTVEDFKRNIISQFFINIYSKRLNEKLMLENPPYTQAQTSYSNLFSKNKMCFQTLAIASQDKQLDALHTLAVENERIKKHGVTEVELQNSINDFLVYQEQLFNERNNLNSSNYFPSIENNFLNGDAMPSIEYTYDLISNLVPTITVNDVNSLIKSFIKDENRVVIILSPEKQGVPVLTEKDVVKALDISNENIEEYQNIAIEESLVRTAITPGKITNISSNEKVGTTTFTLSNGAKVTYKKTDFKNDEILFTGLSFGGMSVLDNDTYKKIKLANSAVVNSGIAGMNIAQLNTFSSGKSFSVGALLGDYTQSFSGFSTPKDLEYLFQGIYAYVTDLNYDPKTFDTQKAQMKPYMENLISVPEGYYQNEKSRFINGHNERYTDLIPNEQEWNNTDYKLAHETFKQRFADASGFEFYFVGSIDESKLKEYAEKYLASLPSLNRKDKITDNGDRSIKGIHKKEFYKGDENIAKVDIVFTGETKYSEKENYALKALSEILNIKLTEVLREKEGGIYGAGVDAGLSKTPYESYIFQISFPTNAELTDKLIEITLNEIEKIKKNGPENTDLTKFKEGELRDYFDSHKTNEFWLNNLINSFMNNENIENVFNYEKNIKSVTAKDVQDVAKKYLDKNRIITVLKPESSK